MGSSKGGQEYTVGFRYYVNYMYSVGMASEPGDLDELLEIEFADRKAWKGVISGNGTALVSQIKLFGGDGGEGGVLGLVDFMTGHQDQVVNPSLKQAIFEQTGYEKIPAFKGKAYVYFKGFDGVDMSGTPWTMADPGILDPDENNITSITSVATLNQNVSSITNATSSFFQVSLNRYPKAPRVKRRRCFRGWYASKAVINGKANPIHVVYEAIINPVWGWGHSSLKINSASFVAAADKLYDEQFEFSLRYDTKTKIKDFIQEVMDTINGSLVENRLTGKFEIHLVRDDIVLENIRELNESNFNLDTFSRRAIDKTVNEIIVEYTDSETGTVETLPVQNLANFNMQGTYNSQTRKYPGITNADLAGRVGLRDLKVFSGVLAKISGTTKMSGSDNFKDAYIGEAVKLNFPRFGFNNLVCRIGKMRFSGTKNRNRSISLELLEDAFTMPEDAYTVRPPVGWVDTTLQADPVTNYRLFEMSYYELYTTTTSADRLDWSEDIGIVGVAAEAPNIDSNNLSLYDNDVGQELTQGQFTPIATLAQDTGYSEGTIYINTEGVDTDFFTQTGFGYINGELVYVTGANRSTGAISVYRSMVDTIPAKHSAGDTFWFYQGFELVIDYSLRVDGETVNYKLLPETSISKLPPSSASVVSIDLDNRQLRPYRPGNFRVNSYVAPSFMTGAASFSWSHRNRLQELAPMPTLFTAGSITVEPGVTYSYSIQDEDGVTRVSVTGSSGTSHSYTNEETDVATNQQSPTGVFEIVGGTKLVPAPMLNKTLTFNLKSVRDGLDSYQQYNHTVERIGYGYMYKNLYRSL